MPQRKSQKKKRVVITGVGPICSLGLDKENVFENLLKAKTNVELNQVYVSPEFKESFYLHKVKNFDISNFDFDALKLQEIEKWKRGPLSLDFLYLIASIKSAINDSNIEINSKKEEDSIGLFLTNENIGLGPFYDRILKTSFGILKTEKEISLKEYFTKFIDSFEREAYELQTFMPLYHIAKLFGIKGYSLFVNNACASGLYAMEAASQAIETGKCEKAIVAASDQPDIYKYIWFKMIDMYANDGLIKPFSEACNGFVFGEGGGAIVLEDYDSAIKRNVEIYGEYLAGGFLLENFKVTFPHVGSRDYSNAIEQALCKAGIQKDEVDLVCAHGVGTTISDQYEARSIKEVFSEENFDPLVTCLKPYVGHNLGGCTILETIILLLSIQRGVVPAVLNCDKVHQRIKINLNLKNIERNTKTFLKICNAFAGYDAACVFKKI